MDFIKRDDIKKNALPGRVVQNAVGHNSACLLYTSDAADE